MPSETNKGLFMLLPDGPIWKSEDVKSMQGFMEEFNRRAEEGDSPELLPLFERIIDTLGVETCAQALDRVKEQRQQQQQLQQQQQPQQQHLPGYQSNNYDAAVSSTAYPNRTTANATRHEQENGVHTGQGIQAAETLQTLMTSHVGEKSARSPMAADEPGESGSGNDSSSCGGGGDAFHSATGPSESSPSHSLSLSPLGNNNNNSNDDNNTNAMDLLPLQSQATLYGQSEGTSGPSTGGSSPGAFGTTTTAPSSNDNPAAPVIPPATLSWAGVPPIPATLPSLQAPTLRMPIPPIAYTFEGMTRHFATTAGGNGTTVADLSHTVKPEISPAAAGSRKRTRSSSASSSAPAPAPAPAPAAAAEAAAALTVTTTSLAAAVEDGYIPTPRNDGPWHYLGTLPSSSSASSSSAGASNGGGGGGGGGRETGGGGGAATAAAASSGSASSAGSDEEGTKARPAAMNFGRYGDHLPYNGRKVCRVKGCDGNQRWPDYLCGQHGGGRCRWEGCTLFHQGINSMGLLLCGKHCKAVGATYRRPRGGGNPKADRGGGGGGGVTASSSAARKRK